MGETGNLFSSRCDFCEPAKNSFIEPDALLRGFSAISFRGPVTLPCVKIVQGGAAFLA